MLMLNIPGKPIAKKRPRFARRGKFVTTYNDQETEEGKFMIQVLDQLPDGFKPYEKGVPISLVCCFDMYIPVSASKKKQRQMQKNEIMHTKKPDLDNLVKFVKDCLNSIVWHDDSQVVSVTMDKSYNVKPKTTIIITQRSKI